MATQEKTEAMLRSLGAAIVEQLATGHEVKIIRSTGTVYNMHVTRAGVDAAAVIPLEGRAIRPDDVAALAAMLAPKLSATLDLAQQQLAIADAVEKAATRLPSPATP
jgi:hypothetical protein